MPRIGDSARIETDFAIIIYDFRLALGRCNHETSHLFVFREPNRVSIVAGEETWQP